MDFSSTPIDKLIEYQLALSNVMRLAVLYTDTHPEMDCGQSYMTLLELNGKIEAAIKDEQFEMQIKSES